MCLKVLVGGSVIRVWSGWFSLAERYSRYAATTAWNLSPKISSEGVGHPNRDGLHRSGVLDKTHGEDRTSSACVGEVGGL